MLSFLKGFNDALALAAIVGWAFGIYFIIHFNWMDAVLAWSLPTGIGLGSSITRLFIKEGKYE